MNVVAYVAAVRDMEGVLDHISVSACQLVESRGVSRTESRVGVLGATVPSAFQADASVDLWPLPTVVDLDAACISTVLHLYLYNNAHSRPSFSETIHIYIDNLGK